MRTVGSAALILIGLAVLVHQTISRRFVVVTVAGSSMQPYLNPGDRVLVRRTTKPKRNQVIVFTHQNVVEGPVDVVRLVKRVAAVPGDSVPTDVRARVEDRVVPDDTVVVLGDNPEHSYDSRELGLIPVHQILGVVVRQIERNVGQPRKGGT